MDLSAPSALAALIALTACAATVVEPPTATVTVVPVEEVVWEQLNPARGDQSPRAATLYGDRGGPDATGFLLRPVDGFRSPPHIHNVSYRAVVLRGVLHNDDPDAADQWMPTGSFWTQPLGAVHITAALGADTLAYVEIDSGPYLVQPVDEAFASGEVPINVDPSNLVWLAADELSPLLGSPGDSVRVATLWGDPSGAAPGGVFLELAAGAEVELRSHGGPFRAVVVEGALELGGSASPRVLEQGSYLGSTGVAEHRLRAGGGAVCLLYVRTDGGIELR